MNEFIHFFTGYLIARAMKYRSNSFLTFYLAIMAVLPDFDYVVRIFVHDFEHGVISHTYLGGMLFVLIFSVYTTFFLNKSMKKIAENSSKKNIYKTISLKTLIWYGFIGISSHFVLDSFTYYESAADARHHLYFWPISSFAPHINTLFPGTTYETRVLVEVVYCIAVALIILADWIIGKSNNNPFLMFKPGNWVINIKKTEIIGDREVINEHDYIFPEDAKIYSYSYYFSCLVLIILMLISSYLL